MSSDDVKIILERLKEQDEKLDLKLEPIRRMVEMHDRTLFGNGSEGNQGIRVDVDRLKQRGTIINWVLVAMGAPIFGYIGKKIVDVFRS